MLIPAAAVRQADDVEEFRANGVRPAGVDPFERGVVLIQGSEALRDSARGDAAAE
jgi:hypothetical protein